MHIKTGLMIFKIQKRFLIVVLLIIWAAPVWALAAANESPLEEYLLNLDEVGRTLSRWQGEDHEMNSWFFCSYAMLILQNYGRDDLQAFPTFKRLVPSIWSDFKNVNPRYLIELAGGTLAFNDLMKVQRDEPFNRKRAEEQYILIINGYALLRMLQGTVGDSLFKEVVRGTTASANSVQELEQGLASAISEHYDPWVGDQFLQAMSSGEWTDAEISRVRRSSGAVKVSIAYNSRWSFPVDVLFISREGDSSLVKHEPQQGNILSFSGHDVRTIILDPDHKLAEYYRYNNKWPSTRNRIYVQPFATLPSWENYRIKVNPTSWSDWDDEKRYGLRFTSGFGIDLWPAYPSDFRHRVSWELNAHTKLNKESYWGGRLIYGHPVSRKQRLFSEIQMHSYADWKGASLGVTKYIGEQSFLIHGPRLKYQRLKLSLDTDSYQDTSIWKQNERVNVLRMSYSGLSITRYGDRLLVSVQSAYGQSEESNFSMIKTQIDLSGVFWKTIVTGIQMVGGSQSASTPGPYQFTYDFAWQDNLAALPRFRGQTRIDHPTDNYLGLSVSGGYWFSWLQAKLFGSTILFDQESVTLSESRPHYAFGFGVEHKSFFTLGLYFPIWQSHPVEGENSWAWRYQWRLVWNL